MKIRWHQIITLFFISALPGAVLAHTGHETGSGFLAGLAHPLFGPDHLAAMLLVGLWASRSVAVRMNLPLIGFSVFMVIGALLAASGINLAAIESMIALSLLVPGLLLITGVRINSIGSLVIAFFALFHGQAHMLEMATLASPLVYACGFMLTTITLLLTGLGAGICLQRLRYEWLLRSAGLATGGFGALLLLGAN
mgnify:CR=1 FL=1